MELTKRKIYRIDVLCLLRIWVMAFNEWNDYYLSELRQIFIRFEIKLIELNNS